MKKEDLYKAIGGIKSGYITDVPGKMYSEMKSSRPLLNERTIVMDVVKQKKIRLRIFAVAAAVLVAAGVVAAAFGILRNNKKDDKITQKKIENYFTDNRSYDLEINQNIENLAAGKERIFFISYLAECEPVKKLAVYDKKTKSTKEIDISGLYMDFYEKIYLSDDCSFIFYKDRNQNDCICRFDNDFSTENTINIKTEGYINKISETNRDTILVTESISYGDSCEMKVLEYSKDTLELINTISFDDLISGGAYSTITDVLHADGSFWIVCEKKNGQTDLIRCTSEGETIFLAENICGDMEGTYSGCLMTAGGDITVFTSFVNSAGVTCHSFDQLSGQTGEIIFRYDDVLDENGMGTAYINEVVNSGSEYDFAYLSYNTGTVFGYSFDNEEKTEIWKIKDPSSQELQSAAFSEECIVYGYSDSSDEEKGTSLFISDLSGNIIRKILLHKDKSYEITGINVSMYVGENDELYLIKNDYENISGTLDMRTVNTLYHYSRDGELIDSFKLALPESDPRKKLEGTFRNYDDFTVSGNGSMIFVQGEVIDFFDSDGVFTGELEYEGRTGRIASVNDEIYLISDSSEYDSEPGKIYRINDKENCLEYLSDFSYIFSGPESQVFDGDSEYDFYLSESDGIYGYKISEKRMDEIINWVDSDLDAKPATVAVLDKDRIMCGVNDYLLSFDPHDYNNKISAFMLERVSDEVLKQVQEREILTVACDYVDEALMKKIAEFNRTHQECRITVREYSRFFSDDVTGLDPFNKDLITGIVPDIVINSGEIDMARYSQLGMFADLNELIDSSNGISRSDYYDNVFLAFSEKDGLYEIPVFFYLNEMIGRESDMGDIGSVTYADLCRISEDKKVFSGSSDELIRYLIKSNITEFVDFENYRCDFDNDDFKGIINLIKREADEGYGGSINNIQDDFLDSKCMLSICRFGNMDAKYLTEKLREPFVYINYPSSGSDGTLVSTGLSAAIAEKSKNKEAAWEFIKILLSDDYQNKANLFEWYQYIPVKRSSAEKYFTDDKERMISLIESATRRTINDTRINNIIDEQLDVFLSDEQSTEDTAKSIQHKVSMYLKEIR